jgi:hypothetical protein
MGHTELDLAMQYHKTGRPFLWAGGVNGSKLPNYVSRMNERYGPEEAEQVLITGPPHAMIFPNLFLSEMNIMTVDPRGPEETVTLTTPVFLAGADELNRRTALQNSGAMGPAGLFIADDGEIADRNQVALHTVKPSWLDLSRGVEREQQQGLGEMSEYPSDETAQRGMWRHYRALMAGAVNE